MNSNDHTSGTESCETDGSSSRHGTFANLFDRLPVGRLEEELFTTLFQDLHVRVERIVSTGQSTPADEWYDQSGAEWVLLVQGRAWLRFEDQPDLFEMGPGDFVLIPARRRHRVESTDPDATTVWLAVHLEGQVGT